MTGSRKNCVVNVPPSIDGTVNVSVNLCLQSLVDLDEREQILTTNGCLDVEWIYLTLA